MNAALDRFGIPGDRHLIVAECAWDDLLLSELLTARRYWEAKGLSTTLVVVPEHASQALRPPRLDDGIVDLSAATVPVPDREALLAAAHLHAGG